MQADHNSKYSTVFTADNLVKIYLRDRNAVCLTKNPPIGRLIPPQLTPIMESFYNPLLELEVGQYPYVDSPFSFLGASGLTPFGASDGIDALLAMPDIYMPPDPYDFNLVQTSVNDICRMDGAPSMQTVPEIVERGRAEPFYSLSIHLKDLTAGTLPFPTVSNSVVDFNYPLAEDKIDVLPSLPTSQPYTQTSFTFDVSPFPSYPLPPVQQPHPQPGPFHEGKDESINHCSRHSQDDQQNTQSAKHAVAKRYRRYLSSSFPLVGAKC